MAGPQLRFNTNNTSNTTTEKKKEKKKPLYYTINILAAFAHLGNAIAMLIIYAIEQKDSIFKLTTSYPLWQQVSDNFKITTETLHVSDISLHWTIFTFHLLSFIFQIGALIPQYQYIQKVKNGTNPLRFIEYALSASLMLISIALLTGITDIVILILMCVANAACMFCGAAAEYLKTKTGKKENQQHIIQRIQMATHIVGWVCILAAYMPILLSFFVANSQAEKNGGRTAPWFVDLILGAQCLLFMSFGFVQLLQLYGTQIPYLRFIGQNSEIAYTALSLIAKTLLGWLIYSNVIAMGQGI